MPIKLTQGSYTLVDGEDFERLSKYKWYAEKNRNTFYAKTYNGNKGLRIHQLIIKIPTNMGCDHKNGNGLDNRKCNLRCATNGENQHNMTKTKLHTSIYKGVSWKKQDRKWVVQISCQSKDYHLGYFDSEIEAARKYDRKAKELFGEFAKTNF